MACFHSAAWPHVSKTATHKKLLCKSLTLAALLPVTSKRAKISDDNYMLFLSMLEEIEKEKNQHSKHIYIKLCLCIYSSKIFN